MAERFFIYMRDAFDTLDAEAAEVPRMLAVAVHGRLIGRPGRIGGLARVVDHGQGHDGVWICRRRDIARHWITHCPYGENWASRGAPFILWDTAIREKDSTPWTCSI